MLRFTDAIPLSLYIHIPWCVKKCLYCDFNSHESRQAIPEEEYVAALLKDLTDHLPYLGNRSLTSIFFGGGTPSLFSPQAIEKILQGVNKQIAFLPNIEITMEANPGTMEQKRFKDFNLAGINRLSLGVQSLQDEKLKTLGRIHDSEAALKAIACAAQAGFRSFNVDIMYGLPNQTIDEALGDLKQVLDFSPAHLSWYQLTIEPNTFFYRYPPPLPVDDLLWDMQLAGLELIKAAGLKQYEVSAYAKSDYRCKHNRNYWEFGDYLGIGAGAHSKITDVTEHKILRHWQVKQPGDYLNPSKRTTASEQTLVEKDIIFEFMLNALRLTDGVVVDLFSQRTGISVEKIIPALDRATDKGLLIADKSRIEPTELGKRFLNDLVGMFLE